MDADGESASSWLAFEQAAPVDDSDFNENEHLLIAEVARSLEPRLGEIIRTWTTAILPAQPFAESIVGGEGKLRVAGGEESVKETAHRLGRPDARLAPPLRDRRSEIVWAGRVTAAV